MKKKTKSGLNCVYSFTAVSFICFLSLFTFFCGTRYSPPNKQTLLLEKFLAQYEEIQKNGGWKKIPYGDTLRHTMRNERIILLKKRLIASGELKEDQLAIEDSFDLQLENAVKLFQEKNGLAVTGVVERKTLYELNTPVQFRVTQLKTNIERWKNIAQLHGTFIFVNAASFTLDVMENDSSLLTMKVIVGKARRRTPVLNSELSYIEFNPYWYVPEKLARLDVVDKAQKDSAYLTKHRMNIYKREDGTIKKIDYGQVDWKKFSEGSDEYTFVQRPGESNALGKIKFMFPNKYKVYMHDTPTKKLFDAPLPMFSSGCVRLQDARSLATFLLNKEGDWNESKIDSVISTGKTSRVYLKNKIPVYIQYFTAWVDTKGELNFRRDIYQRDYITK